MSEVGPVAIPQNQPEAAPPASARNELPPSYSNGHDPALDGFYKIAAERRERVGAEPYTLPFPSVEKPIRVHRTMPGGFAFDIAEVEVDPHAARRILRSVVVDDELERLDAILLLPPSNPEAIDGPFLVGFLEQIAKLYGAIPLDD